MRRSLSEDLKKYRNLNEAVARGTFEIPDGVAGVSFEDGVTYALPAGTYDVLSFGGLFMELKRKGSLLQPSFFVHVNDLPMATFDTEIQESLLNEKDFVDQIYVELGSRKQGDEIVDALIRLNIFTQPAFVRGYSSKRLYIRFSEQPKKMENIFSWLVRNGYGSHMKADIKDATRGWEDGIKENLNEGYERHIKDILDKAGLDGYFENGILYTPDDPSEIAHALKSSGEIYTLPEIRPLPDRANENLNEARFRWGDKVQFEREWAHGDEDEVFTIQSVDDDQRGSATYFVADKYGRGWYVREKQIRPVKRQNRYENYVNEAFLEDEIGHWVIDFDVLEGKKVQIVGPSRSKLSVEDIKARGKKFRLRDDDGEIYYTGYWVESKSGHDYGNPLDDYGMPAAGCTYIEVWEDGRWKQY